MVSRYVVYKQALLHDAERLAHAQVLREQEDIFYLRFAELHDVVRTNHVDEQLIRERKEAFRSYQALTPPRVLTSDGEVVAGRYRRADVPAGALVGCPFPPVPSRGGLASSWTWPRPISKRATSWSPPTRTPAGRLYSSRSRVWSRKSGAS
jgi:hypothetical protein